MLTGMSTGSEFSVVFLLEIFYILMYNSIDLMQAAMLHNTLIIFSFISGNC